MHDEKAFWCILALTLPVAAALAFGCVQWGGTVRDALFALLKVAVIR